MAGYARRVKVDAWECSCARCPHKWTAYGSEPPKRCASCKAPGWLREATAGGFAGMNPALAARLTARGLRTRRRNARARKVEPSKRPKAKKP